MSASLLIEIGCEEIPARMIPGAASDFAARVTAILDQAAIARGAATGWGGTRRIAVRIDGVADGESAREELVLGPPVAAAFGADGTPTPAGAGFARKQGIDPAKLERVTTEKGTYAGFRRSAGGRTLAAILAETLPGALATMSFPKTMRWAAGTHRWVRPIHWIVALHGEQVLPLEAFGVSSSGASRGHRFLATGGSVAIPNAAAYEGALERAYVVVSAERRRVLLRDKLEAAAGSAGGSLVADEALLEEVVDLVEWPGVVTGSFDRSFLDLPAEILVTTLRHHQKSFSVRGAKGEIAPAFLAVANTDRDSAGHIRRGNEWVVSGRLEDARFFWNEDRSRSLASRLDDLARVVYHAKIGTYRDKADRLAGLADSLGDKLGLNAQQREAAAAAARLAKVDLVTGLVGEFPELQGLVGGLLLEAEGTAPDVARAVYEHYRPQGPGDAIPESITGCVVALADKLDTVASLLAIGEIPTGSRDPFGLRRASAGIMRIVIDRKLPVSVADLAAIAGGGDVLRTFLAERLENYLRDTGFSANEVAAVMKAGASATWSLPSVGARLAAIASIRGRDDFAMLVDLVKRVANIRRKNAELVVTAEAGSATNGVDTEAAVVELDRLIGDLAPRIDNSARSEDFATVIDALARFVAPVEGFFQKALVVNPDDPVTTHRRLRLLGRLEGILTRHFDLRELPGQADRRD